MALTERYVTTTGAGSHNGTSEDNAWTFAEFLAEFATDYASATDGVRVNIKDNATYELTATSSMPSTSGATRKIAWVRGYSTTIGDGGRPTLSYSASRFFSLGSSCVGWWIQDLDLTGSHSGSILAMSGDNCIAYRVHAVNSNANGEAATIMDGAAYSCFFEAAGDTQNVTSAALVLNRGNAYNTIVKTTGDQYIASMQGAFRTHAMEGCILVGSGATGQAGLFVNGGSNLGPTQIMSNVVYNVGGSAIDIEGPGSNTSAGIQILHNVLYDANYGIEVDTNMDCRVHAFSNAIGSVTSGRLRGFNGFEEGNAVTLTADPFEDAANEDFRLNNTVGGGALCRSIIPDGGPFNLMASGTSGTKDLGALQVAVAEAGGPMPINIWTPSRRRLRRR